MDARDENDDFEQALSLERFGRYLQWSGGCRDGALELYALNTQVSEALYIPIQMLEVALRNRIHAAMSVRYGAWWFDHDGVLLIRRQTEQVVDIWAGLIKEKLDPKSGHRVAPTPGQIVAKLTFSFWTAMLSPAYENLWRSDLHRIARREDCKGLRRTDLSKPLGKIRSLRNRIAHHEPILYWNLPQVHADMLSVTGWLSPAAAAWCLRWDRFDKILPVHWQKLPQGSDAGP